MCVDRCVHQVHTNLDYDLNDLYKKSSTPIRFENSQNKELLTKLCRTANESISCIQLCEQCRMKTLFENTLSIWKYVCVETNFVENSLCYEKVNKQMVSVCHSGEKCGRQKMALQSALDLEQTELSEIETFLKSNCEYITCYSGCERAKLVEECGNDGKNVLEALNQKGAIHAHKVFEIFGLNVPLPNECKRLINDDDDAK